MTRLVDVRCPNCGETTAVDKLGLDRHRCRGCDRQFTHGDLSNA